MSGAIEERESSEFQRLSECTSSYGHLAALNGNEFVIVLHNIWDSPIIYKYNVANDRWTPVMSLQKGYKSSTIPAALFDPNTTTLHLAIRDRGSKWGYQWKVHELLSIDTDQWKIRKRLSFPKDRTIKRKVERMLLKVDRIVLIGDEIHCLYDNDGDICRHFVVNNVSGDVIQEPVDIHPNCVKVTNAMFVGAVGSRSNIVVVGHRKRVGSMIAEYSLATQQWNVWEWAYTEYRSGGFVAAMDGRYILSFGGYLDRDESDSILIYDVERKLCVESELKLPKKCAFCQAVLMTDRNRGELLTCGFIKRCYKAEEFRNVLILPTALVLLIGKCFVMEFVHVIMDSAKRGPHYRVNVDDILKSVAAS